ncbi:MAG: sulfotransferase domain-containing protein [Hyphomonadaceae bacterium]
MDPLFHMTPVFLRSSKCGKNLVYLFFGALGAVRRVWEAAPAVLHRAHYGEAGLQNYAFPGASAPTEAEVERAWSEVESHIRALGPGAITHGHFLPDRRLISLLSEQKVGTAFVIRDPRDALVSMLNYARAQALPVHIAEILNELSDEEALQLLLDGGGRLTPFAEYFDAYHGWLSEPSVLVLRFEDLVGVAGGGDVMRQRQACAALAGLANISSADERFALACEHVFNPRAGTFFRGQLGAWRERFTPAIAREYERRAGWLNDRWGYGG